MRLFPTKHPLESFSVYLLDPLPKTKTGNWFLLVMPDRFTKRTQVVPLKCATRFDVAKAFDSHWVFKNGVPKESMSDNGPKLARRLYQNT